MSKDPSSILKTVSDVANQHDGNGIYSVGATAAIRAMSQHWQSHLAEGHDTSILSRDIDGAIEQLQLIQQDLRKAFPPPASCRLSYLDLATNHVSQKTMEWMTTTPDVGFTIAPYTYGAFVSVYDEESLRELGEEDDRIPADLLRVLRYARAHDLDVVRFDADGDRIDALPAFNW